MKLSARNQIEGKILEIKKGATTVVVIKASDVMIGVE